MYNALSKDALLECLSTSISSSEENVADKMRYSGYVEYSRDGENRVDEYDRIYYV